MENNSTRYQKPFCCLQKLLLTTNCSPPLSLSPLLLAIANNPSSCFYCHGSPNTANRVWSSMDSQIRDTPQNTKCHGNSDRILTTEHMRMCESDGTHQNCHLHPMATLFWIPPNSINPLSLHLHLRWAQTWPHPHLRCSSAFFTHIID